MKFSTNNIVIENVNKIAIQFDGFPNRDISVKDLTVHACISKGMYYWCYCSSYCCYYYYYGTTVLLLLLLLGLLLLLPFLPF